MKHAMAVRAHDREIVHRAQLCRAALQRGQWHQVMGFDEAFAQVAVALLEVETADGASCAVNALRLTCQAGVPLDSSMPSFPLRLHPGRHSLFDSRRVSLVDQGVSRLNEQAIETQQESKVRLKVSCSRQRPGRVANGDDVARFVPSSQSAPPTEVNRPPRKPLYGTRRQQGGVCASLSLEVPRYALPCSATASVVA